MSSKIVEINPGREEHSGGLRHTERLPSDIFKEVLHSVYTRGLASTRPACEYNTMQPLAVLKTK
jgi:hypothetical protein